MKRQTKKTNETIEFIALSKVITALVEHPSIDYHNQQKLFELLALSGFIPDEDMSDVAINTGCWFDRNKWFYLEPNHIKDNNEVHKLGLLLSMVLSNPEIPSRLYKVIQEELNEVPEGFYSQPVWVVPSLLELHKKDRD